MHNFLEKYLTQSMRKDATFFSEKRMRLNYTLTVDADVHWFFFGGNDTYHLIENSDFGCSLYPGKIYSRSETVDLQRGEVEWKGGNLYFDKWDYHIDIEYLN